MADSAERRARRKLLAEVYNGLPSREALNAAAELERTKMQRAVQDEQFALQRGSLAVAVLSQLPRDNEENKPLFAEARSMLLEVLKRGVAQLQEEDDNEELHEELADEELADEEGPL